MNILLDPNIAYLLLLGGTFLGLLALVTPGTGAIEVGSLFCLLLAGYSITQLDFNLWALVLIILSVVPFIYAIRKPKRGVFLAASILILVASSAYLFRDPNGGPAVSPLIALVASVLYFGFLWFAIRKSLQAYFTPPTHDLNSLIGQFGETKTRVHDEGSVQVAGELWSARSRNPIPPAKQVRVISREGFTLEVEQNPDK